MTDTEHQKIHIERAIERARDGVSERIDELDQKLRQSFDLGSVASQHAPKIVGAGAAVGFLVGFGSRYAGGCTSGHAIMGLSTLQWPSVVATVCFMVGGFLMANLFLPFILG